MDDTINYPLDAAVSPLDVVARLRAVEHAVNTLVEDLNTLTRYLQANETREDAMLQAQCSSISGASIYRLPLPPPRTYVLPAEQYPGVAQRVPDAVVDNVEGAREK